MTYTFVKIAQEIGLNAKDYGKADDFSCFKILKALHEQSQCVDDKGSAIFFQLAARQLYLLTFGHEASEIPFYDRENQITWIWESECVQHPKITSRTVQGRYHISLEGQYLCIYACAKFYERRLRLKFDLKSSACRREFLFVNQCVKTLFHATPVKPRNKSLLTVQFLDGYNKHEAMVVHAAKERAKGLNVAVLGFGMLPERAVLTKVYRPRRGALKFAGFELSSSKGMLATAHEKVEKGDLRELKASRRVVEKSDSSKISSLPSASASNATIQMVLKPTILPAKFAFQDKHPPMTSGLKLEHHLAVDNLDLPEGVKEEMKTLIAAFPTATKESIVENPAKILFIFENEIKSR